jgi:hypothetical protein
VLPGTADTGTRKRSVSSSSLLITVPVAYVTSHAKIFFASSFPFCVVYNLESNIAMMVSFLKSTRPALQRLTARSFSLNAACMIHGTSRVISSTQKNNGHLLAFQNPLSYRRSFSTSDDDNDNDDIVMVSIDEARSTTALALQKIGWDEQDAALQAEIMTAAELCGNNQVRTQSEREEQKKETNLLASNFLFSGFGQNVPTRSHGTRSQ